MSKEFGDCLRKLRAENNLTQKQVSEALHIDRSTYAYYERGTTEPSLVTVRKLAKVFNVSLEDLLPDTDNKQYAKVSDVTNSGPVSKTKDEELFLRWYRNLTPTQKEDLKHFAGRLKGRK